jgi:hypothetical protein
MQIQGWDYLYAYFLKRQNKLLAMAICQVFNLPIVPGSLLLEIPDRLFDPVIGQASDDFHWSRRIRNFFFPKKSSASQRNINNIKDSISCSTAASTTCEDSLPSTKTQKRVKCVRFQEPKIALSDESVPDNNRKWWDWQFENHDRESNDKDNASESKTGINFKVLEGHPYEIVPNPKADFEHNKHLYICRYEECGKTFAKTYNLVYHFRVHTNEKSFECKHCKKRFSQKGNLGRHLETHNTSFLMDRKGIVDN